MASMPWSGMRRMMLRRVGAFDANHWYRPLRVVVVHMAILVLRCPFYVLQYV